MFKQKFFPFSFTNISILLLMLLVIASCGGLEVPSKEMVKAKIAISAAEENYQASEYAPTMYQGAIAKLKESHTAAKDGEMEDAEALAIKAQELAQKAQEIASPKMSQASIDEAKAMIEEAIEVNAEEYAPDELQKAQIGVQQAELKFEQKDYETSNSTAKQATADALNAKNIALGKKNMLKTAIQEVTQTLINAKEYGAEEIAPAKMKSAKADLSLAVSTYKSNDLKKCQVAVESAKVKADELYLLVIKTASQKNIDKADKQYTLAAESAGAKIAVDELNGSKEMLDSSKAEFNDANYSKSIDSSNESLKLSAAVLDAAGQAPVVDTSDTGDYWLYTVQKKKSKPKDCLRSIADKFYKDEMKWKLIYKANKDKIKNPNLIYPGWELKVPKTEEASINDEMDEALDSSDSSVDTSDMGSDGAGMKDSAETDIDETDSDAVPDSESEMIPGEAPESSQDGTIIIPAE